RIRTHEPGIHTRIRFGLLTRSNRYGLGRHWPLLSIHLTRLGPVAHRNDLVRRRLRRGIGRTHRGIDRFSTQDPSSAAHRTTTSPSHPQADYPHPVTALATPASESARPGPPATSSRRPPDRCHSSEPPTPPDTTRR